VVDEVDNQQGIVSVTVFAGFDPSLKELFAVGESVTACVGEDSLRTWDQINDKKNGPVTEVQSVQSGPGNSGLRIKFKPVVLLEGFRPTRIVRLFPAPWRSTTCPRKSGCTNSGRYFFGGQQASSVFATAVSSLVSGRP
jgi:hypothetical protein